MREGEKGWDCEKCTARDKDARGCRGKRKWKVGSFEYRGCPQRLVNREFGEAMSLYVRYKNFGWPFSGGWGEQPARFFDMIEAFENESNFLTNQRIEKVQNGNQ
jgi:hypothetical protein